MAPSLELPAWAIDLVIALQQHEDEHPDNGAACLIDPLNAVPEDARHAAQIIAAYRQQSPPPDLSRQLDEAEKQARGWEEKYFAMGEKRSEALAAIDRVQKVPTAPSGAVPGDLADWGSFLRGYELGILAAKSALRLAAHIVDPVWCRNCPPETSHTGNPGWHQYEPAKAQR
uniref:hypothetical protein n=1 Tax=Streptomyces tubercidicus TaxID=47759 RepID=UPI0030E15A74